MKRFLAVFLALVMVFCSIAVFAEEGAQAPDAGASDGAQASDGTDAGASDGDQASDGDAASDGAQASDGTDAGASDGDQASDGDAASDGEAASDGGAGSPGGTAVEGALGSYLAGGTDENSVAGNDYAYDAALYVTAEGIDGEKSTPDRITEGAFDEKGADGIVLKDSDSGHNGILITEAEYTVTGATIEMITDADGRNTCDFSGLGAAIAVYGNSKVSVENSTITTAGVATMPLYADNGAVLTVKNCTLISKGGTLHKEYMNTYETSVMVATPWILGIMGTSRCLNVLGANTTVNVLDTDASAGAWAVLSTDNGSNMALNVFNTKVTVLNAKEDEAAPLQAEGGQVETLDNPYSVNYGSGYGLFMIGGTTEVVAGSEINSGTYIAIMAGGNGTFTALENGKTYELKSSAGEVTGEYTAEADKITELHSDTFGFMSHQGNNTITLEKGTVLDTGFASFLTKVGYTGGQSTTATVDGAVIRNGGVLIQMMDNDDTTTNGVMAVDDERNTNGGSSNFNPVHYEQAGFRTEEAAADTSVQNFTFKNGEYAGSIYNATGSDGLKGSALNVTFGAGAKYSGAVASTAAIHVTYDGSVAVKENGGFAFDNAEDAAAFAEQYQNTEFGLSEYFSIGQVANLVNSNGSNLIHVMLTDDAVWEVTGTSLLASLSLEGNSQVVIPEGITLTVGETAYTGCTLTADSL